MPTFSNLFPSVCNPQFVLVLLASFFFSRHSTAQYHLLQKVFDSLAAQKVYQQANISFTLIDVANGNILFEKNTDLQLPPASTLKTFTTASALHYLGPDFRFQTTVTFKGKITKHNAVGELRVYGSGDPSLGSDRYLSTQPERVFNQIGKALKQAGIYSFKGKISIIDTLFNDEAIHAAWLDEDIGNYYGTGIHGFNWKENKFSIGLCVKDSQFVVSYNSAGYSNQSDFCSELKPKAGATTESAFAYLTPESKCAYTIRGFLAPSDSIQTIQLARIHPAADFELELGDYLIRNFHYKKLDTIFQGKETKLCTIQSPSLDSIVYYCNQKSLNLYAEALCKTIAVRLYHHGNWKEGIAAMQRYARRNGMNSSEIDLHDASGLAPTNRITTHILADLLRVYSKEHWYTSFYNSLPLINGLHMKSGYIGGTRSYAGYLTLAKGRKACFAFIINQYTCSPQVVKADMFAILDRLKTSESLR